MKKLMVMLGAVAVAAASQAAYVTWGTGDMITTEGLDCSASIAKNNCVKMFVWEFAEADWDTSYETAGGIWSAVQDGTLDLATAKTAVSASGIAKTPGADTWADAQVVYAAILFLHSDTQTFTKDGASHYMENASAEGAVATWGMDVGDLGITWGGDGSEWGGATGSTSWQSVPEPTSGLLLLLGVAGLALRRRRA